VTRVSLAAVAAVALIGAAACKDAVTSPENSSDLTPRYDVGNPPPPPIDTGATGSFLSSIPELRAPSTSKFLQPRYSIVQSSPTESRQAIVAAPRAPRFDFSQSPFFFSVPITYLFNPTKNAGYIHFSNDPDGVNSSANGMIKNNHGKLSGKGKLQIQTDAGLLVIDLSSIQQPPSFLGCPIPETFAPTNVGDVCFSLFFDHATLYPPVGDPIEGSAQMEPGCTPESCEIIE
jgi:hypothetical protein